MIYIHNFSNMNKTNKINRMIYIHNFSNMNKTNKINKIK